MIRTLCLFCALLVSAWGVRIGTYNVENLFDAIKQGTEYPQYVPNNHGWDSQMASKKLSNTAYGISKIGADILGIQEIENESLLAKLAQETNYPHYVFAASRGAPTGVGLLSRYPIKFSKQINHPHERVRPSLHVKLDIDGDELDIIVVHWPSLKNTNHFREAAAVAIDGVMKEIKEGIVLGDFNDPFSAKSVVLNTWGPLETHEGWFDPWFGTYPKWSHDFFGDKKVLDRMLLSEGLFDGKGLDFVCGSFEPLRYEPFVKDGIPNRWEISDRGKGKHLGNGYSDHLPLVLELSKKPFTCKAKKANINELLSQKSANVNFEISKVTVLYNHKDGMILGDGSGSVHVFQPGFSKPIGTVMDIHVSAMGEFFGMKEIRALHVKKIYDEKEDPKGLMLPFEKLKDAKPADVLTRVSGMVKKGKLETKYGSIDLHVKPSFPKPKEGQKLELERVRVGEYRGRVQLILEERE